MVESLSLAIFLKYSVYFIIMNIYKISFVFIIVFLTFSLLDIPSTLTVEHGVKTVVEFSVEESGSENKLDDNYLFSSLSTGALEVSEEDTLLYIQSNYISINTDDFFKPPIYL